MPGDTAAMDIFPNGVSMGMRKLSQAAGSPFQRERSFLPDVRRFELQGKRKGGPDWASSVRSGLKLMSHGTSLTYPAIPARVCFAIDPYRLVGLHRGGTRRS